MRYVFIHIDIVDLEIRTLIHESLKAMDLYWIVTLSCQQDAFLPYTVNYDVIISDEESIKANQEKFKTTQHICVTNRFEFDPVTELLEVPRKNIMHYLVKVILNYYTGIRNTEALQSTNTGTLPQ